MVKSGDLVAVKLNVQVAKGKVEQRTMYVQKGMEITLDKNSVYTVKDDGVYTNGKKVSNMNLTASQYSIMSGVGITQSEGLPENKVGDSFVLSEKDIAAAYSSRHDQEPQTKINIATAEQNLKTGETVHLNNSDYKVSPNGITVHTRAGNANTGGGTEVSIFMKK